MPNFKQLLNAAMKPLSTNANSPANSFITIDAGSASFVPPSDGFVRFRAQSTSSGTWVNIAQQQMFTESPSINNGSRVNVWLRVVKGVVVTFNELNTTNVEKFFIPCLGGGDHLLLKALQSGGKTCLRLKNFLTLGRSELERLNFRDTSPTLCRKEDRQATSARLTLSRHLTDMHKSQPGTATPQGSSTTRSSLGQLASATEGFGAAARILQTIVRSCLAGKVIRFTFNFPSLLTKHQKCKGELFSSLVQVSIALSSLSANWEEVRYVA